MDDTSKATKVTIEVQVRSHPQGGYWAEVGKIKAHGASGPAAVAALQDKLQAFCQNWRKPVVMPTPRHDWISVVYPVPEEFHSYIEGRYFTDPRRVYLDGMEGGPTGTYREGPSQPCNEGEAFEEFVARLDRKNSES